MAAKRCALCGINYPNITEFSTCPLHGEETAYVKAEPDANWKEALARIKAQLDKADELARPVPLVHTVEPYVEHGLLWLDHGTLMQAGFHINRIGPSFRLFELDDGFIYETQGWDEPGRRWWVERVVEA